jgi:hypothetical protein
LVTLKKSVQVREVISALALAPLTLVSSARRRRIWTRFLHVAAFVPSHFDMSAKFIIDINPAVAFGV